jgi:enamine deaminase RidA (YjgF/YER057c/UK114 family)
MERIKYGSGSQWESVVGYSRAVKVGNVLEVTGTVATDENNEVVGLGDPYTQTHYILSKVEKVLIHAGSGMKDVIRTRMFVTDISRWEEYGRAHGEFFKDILPCTTMVEVSRLIGPDYLIEIEVSAILAS